MNLHGECVVSPYTVALDAKVAADGPCAVEREIEDVEERWGTWHSTARRELRVRHALVRIEDVLAEVVHRSSQCCRGAQFSFVHAGCCCRTLVSLDHQILGSARHAINLRFKGGQFAVCDSAITLTPGTHVGTPAFHAWPHHRPAFVWATGLVSGGNWSHILHGARCMCVNEVPWPILTG